MRIKPNPQNLDSNSCSRNRDGWKNQLTDDNMPYKEESTPRIQSELYRDWCHMDIAQLWNSWASPPLLHQSVRRSSVDAFALRSLSFLVMFPVEVKVTAYHCYGQCCEDDSGCSAENTYDITASSLRVVISISHSRHGDESPPVSWKQSDRVSLATTSCEPFQPLQSYSLAEN